MPELSEEQKENLHQLAMLPAGQRYELLGAMALEGFMITIVLSKTEDGKINESINFDFPAKSPEV